MSGPMKGTIVLAFAAGCLCGALAVWMLVPPAPPTVEVPRPPWPPPSPAENRRRIEDPAVTTTGPDPLDLAREQLARLELDLAAARKEARANLLKGALVLEVGGRTPEEILKTAQDLEPEKGTVRFSSDPERLLGMGPWMTLQTIVPEEFEEALARYLDSNLRWVAPLDLAPEEARAIRDFTERAYRLMVEVQQKQGTLRRLLADKGRFTPEERKALEEKFAGLHGLDQRIYESSFQPGFRVPLLFPPAAKK